MSPFSNEFVYRSKFKLQKTLTIKQKLKIGEKTEKLTRGLHSKVTVKFERNARGLLTVEDVGIKCSFSAN